MVGKFCINKGVKNNKIYSMQYAKGNMSVM